MKVERIQLSLMSETKKISRLATTQRGSASYDLTKDEAESSHHKPMYDEREERETTILQALIASESSSAGLLDITA